MVRREFPAGAVILLPGARAGLMAYIETGRITLQAEGIAIRSLGPGDVFGEQMLWNDAPGRYEISAATPVTLWLLARSDWLAVQKALPHTILSKAVEPGPDATGRAAIQHSGAPGGATNMPRKEAISTPNSGSGRWWILFAISLLLTAVFLGQPLVISGGSALALRALDRGQPARAVDILRLALSLQPDSAMLHDVYGYVLSFQGDDQNAEAELLTAAGLDPGLASARHNLGVLTLAKGDATKAITHFQAVIALDPGNAQAYCNLGDAYLMDGQRQLAAAAYQHAWVLDPSLLEARSRWAALILDQGRFAEAEAAWQEVLSRQPGHPDAQLGLGAIRFVQGRPAAALTYLQAVQQANPSDPLARLYLGLSLQELNRPQEAVVEFEQVLALSREPALVDLARRRLLDLYPQLMPSADTGAKGGAQPDGSR